MHIAIDTTPLETGHAQRGVGTYTKNLIDSLQRYEMAHSYSFFTRGQKVPDHADIVHYPYFDPFFLTLPVMKNKPTVVTVHDLTPLVYPDHFPSGIRGTVKWQLQKMSLMSASRIITDSACSKKDITTLTGFHPEKIDVVHLAPDPTFTAQKRNKPKVAKPYFLYVGDVNWNKNVPGLLQAFAPFHAHKLVLVGGAFTDTTLPESQEIDRLIGALGITRSVEKVGYVSDDKLIDLYAGATGLVQPSFYEGFGLPVLEAMSCGCPVITTDTSSLSEIAGPALKVSPDPASITAGMKKLLALSTTKRTGLIEAQRSWVKNFSWQKVARRTAAVYEKAFNNHTGI